MSFEFVEVKGKWQVAVPAGTYSRKLLKQALKELAKKSQDRCRACGQELKTLGKVRDSDRKDHGCLVGKKAFCRSCFLKEVSAFCARNK